MKVTMAQTAEDVAEKASEFLVGVLDRMGVTADIDIKDEDERVTLEIQTADTEYVIGRRGVVIDSLQHLVNKVVYKDRSLERGKPLIVDAGGFRGKQVDRLRQLAERVAEKVKSTGETVELQPMTSHDRRIVHMHISEIGGLATRSEGEGEDRHILVFPADAT
jgi:spoIIIJ-associated protein